MSPTDPVSRVSPNRPGVVVLYFKLFAAGLSWAFIASAWLFVLAAHDSGLCVDDKYKTADRGYQFVDFSCRGRDRRRRPGRRRISSTKELVKDKLRNYLGTNGPIIQFLGIFDGLE